jgi:hypothetical protein
MSDILIRGMEMPKNCLSCDLFYYKNTRETDFSFPRWPCGPWECYNVCVFQGHKKVDIRFRPDECPLVPVPPHGRLGDLDELIKKIPVVSYEIYENIRTLLESAPTIIPAEIISENEIKIIDTKGKLNYDPKRRFVISSPTIIPTEEET